HVTGVQTCALPISAICSAKASPLATASASGSYSRPAALARSQPCTTMSTRNRWATAVIGMPIAGLVPSHASGRDHAASVRSARSGKSPAYGPCKAGASWRASDSNIAATYSRWLTSPLTSNFSHGVGSPSRSSGTARTKAAVRSVARLISGIMSSMEAIVPGPDGEGLVETRLRGWVDPASALAAFRFARHAPSAELAPYLDHHWVVTYADLAEPYEQRIVSHPTVNITITDDFRRVAGVIKGGFSYTMRGSGRVLGTR